MFAKNDRSMLCTPIITAVRVLVPGTEYDAI